MLTFLINFFLTEWIWSITGGSYHIPISCLLMFVLLKLWDHLGWIRAFLLSVFLTFGAFIIYFGLIWVIFVWGLGIEYSLPADTYQGSFDHLNTSLILAAIYSLLQMIMLFFLHKWVRFNFWRTLLCALSANLLTAFLVYKITFGS